MITARIAEAVNEAIKKTQELAARKLIEISKTSNFRLEESCFIGDGVNDIPCFEIVGLPIAYNPRVKIVEKYVKYIISDFKELNKIL